LPRKRRHESGSTQLGQPAETATPLRAVTPKKSNSLVNLGFTVAGLLLAVYAIFAYLRIEQIADPGARLDNRARADLLAAHVESDARSLRAALAAARELAHRLPQSPVDAAEAGLAAAGPSARAVAIVGPDGLLAQTAPDAGWLTAAQAGVLSGQTLWIGAPSGPGRGYYAVLPRDEARPLTIVALIDLTAVLPRVQGEEVSAIITRNGEILAATGVPALPGGLRQAFGVAPTTARSAGSVASGGRLMGGTALEVAQRPIPDTGLIAVVASPEVAGGAARRAIERDTVFSLLAPLIIGIGLIMLLIMQGRRAAEARRAQMEVEHRFRMAVEGARCGIWEWDLAEDRVIMSDVTGVMFGWGGGGAAAGQEVIGRIAPDHQERVRQALIAARGYGAFDVSFRVPKADGRSIWVDARGQAIADARGEYDRIVGVALDVTEERFAQARAQAAETRLRDAIDSVSEAFVLWDRTGRLLMCNKNYRSFFNLEPRVLKPGAPKETVDRFAKLAIAQQAPSPDGRAGVREALLTDGRWIQISERRTADGGMVSTAADITAIKTQDEARRRNEEALQKVVFNLEQSQEQLAELARKYEAEKIKAEGANKSKSEFLANMSHELRTPLNAINGFSEIMVGEMFGPLGDKRYKEYAADILSSGQHLLALINDILDMSKIEAGKMTLKFEPIQFDDLVDDCARLMRNKADSAGLKLEIDLPDLPDVDGDYRALKQILLNLLSNAIKFTPRGGVVTVRATPQTNAMQQRLRVSVSDTGIGIAPADLARLAQPFEQIESQHSKTQQGTGLGLALTKSLVEMHGGLLDLESEPGIGTTASFSIPIHQTAAARPSGSFAA